jgi:hypothetical protein
MSNLYPFDDQFLHDVRRACIAATPKDTGNLAYNALVVHKIPNGFSVRYKGSVAGYGAILNDFRKQRGFTAGNINPHYLWFDSKVHNNVKNLILSKYGTLKKGAATKFIAPSKRTYMGAAEPKYNVNEDSTIEQKNTNNELRQMETVRQWNTRYEEFKNNNAKGWGV